MEIFGKTAFFRADMAGLGKYCMGGYGRIGVYRVKVSENWYSDNLCVKLNCYNCVLNPHPFNTGIIDEPASYVFVFFKTFISASQYIIFFQPSCI